MKNQTIAIIGNGVMGQAIAQNLVLNRVYSRTDIFMVEKNKKCPAAGIIIIAVKPQDFSDLAGQLGNLDKNQLVISIMAGVALAKLKSRLRHRKVVRAMPNLAAQIGQSFTVWKTGVRLSSSERRQVMAIFKALGQALEVGQEDFINKATAISGSGPAYLYYFIEAMIKSAENLGFSKIVAKQMVDQTLTGALGVYSQSGATAGTWRERVTSKKGTTAAALAILEKGKFALLIKQAINAAYKRAKEL